jgi:hypothetical protein
VRLPVRGVGAAGASILSLSPLTLADVLDDIARVETAAGVDDAVHQLIADLRARLDRLVAETAPLSRPPGCYDDDCGSV